MMICCKDCEEIEDFDGSQDAKDNDWHKVGAVWVCPDCWESDYADADNDEEDEDEELELDDDEPDELEKEEEEENETDNLIFFPATKGNMHSSLKKIWDNKKDDVWNDY